jgi:hypothetical protein
MASPVHICCASWENAMPGDDEMTTTETVIAKTNAGC